MLGQRRRRWPNIKPALVQCIVFAGEHGELPTKYYISPPMLG